MVAVALDDHMVYAFCALLHSLKSTATTPFSVIVGYFEGKLSQKHQDLVVAFLQAIQVPYEIKTLTANPLFTERRHLTITTFSKFVISDQVADPHLWIDLDIVARKGWDDFFETLLAAPKGVALVVAQKLESPHTRFDGFNAGVLGWTAEPRAPWVKELANLPDKRFSSEQHLFNTLYRDNFHAIDVRFNFLSSWHSQSEELSRSSLIHYSGPLKPWHLARRHALAWEKVNPSWKYWFSAEEAMAQSLASHPLGPVLATLAREALFSGRLHTGKGAVAGWVLRFLTLAGPLGTPLVWWITRRSAP
jgi:lipopolysaccharide biosynthesis glycosyltransferase